MGTLMQHRFRVVRITLTIACLALLTACTSTSDSAADVATADAASPEAAPDAAAPDAPDAGSVLPSLLEGTTWAYELVEWRVATGNQFEDVSVEVLPDGQFGCSAPSLPIRVYGARGFNTACLGGFETDSGGPGGAFVCFTEGSALPEPWRTTAANASAACVLDGELVIADLGEDSGGIQTVEFADFWLPIDTPFDLAGTELLYAGNGSWDSLADFGVRAGPDERAVRLDETEVVLSIPWVSVGLDDAGTFETEDDTYAAWGVIVTLRLTPA